MPGLLLFCASLAQAAAPPILTDTTQGQGPVNLARAVLTADAVVEAKALPDGAFQVLKSFYGSLASGRRLPYGQCLRLEPRYQPEETLQRIARLPVGTRPPAASARFLLMVFLNRDGSWGFRQRAAGDLYLLERGKAYQLTEDQDDPKKAQLWTPFALAPEERDFNRHLAGELKRRAQFDAARRIEDPKARVEALRGFLEPRMKLDPYVLHAIEALAASGAEGLSALGPAAERPDFETFAPVLMSIFGEKKYAPAEAWLQGRCRAATGQLMEIEYPFEPTNAVLEDAQAYQELQSCVRALGGLGRLDAAPEVRDGAAWLLAHKADWWRATFHSTAEAQPVLALVRSAGPSGPALAAQALSLVESGTPPQGKKMGEWVRGSVKAHSRDAVPLLIWTWKRADPDSAETVRLGLLEAAGRDLGDDPVAWWKWYWSEALHPRR